MKLAEKIRQYIHDYIVFLNVLREHSIILSMATVKELDEFHETVEVLEKQETFSTEDVERILKISTYFSSVSTEFVIDLLDNNGPKIPAKILEFMHQSIEIDQVLRMKSSIEHVVTIIPDGDNCGKCIHRIRTEIIKRGRDEYVCGIFNKPIPRTLIYGTLARVDECLELDPPIEEEE